MLKQKIIKNNIMSTGNDYLIMMPGIAYINVFKNTKIHLHIPK